MIRTRKNLAQIEVIKRNICKEIAYDFDFYSMTQEELAEMVGLHQSEISHILAKKRLEKFSVDRLIMVLIALGHNPTVNVC